MSVMVYTYPDNVKCFISLGNIKRQQYRTIFYTISLQNDKFYFYEKITWTTSYIFDCSWVIEIDKFLATVTFSCFNYVPSSTNVNLLWNFFLPSVRLNVVSSARYGPHFKVISIKEHSFWDLKSAAEFMLNTFKSK